MRKRHNKYGKRKKQNDDTFETYRWWRARWWQRRQEQNDWRESSLAQAPWIKKRCCSTWRLIMTEFTKDDETNGRTAHISSFSASLAASTIFEHKSWSQKTWWRTEWCEQKKLKSCEQRNRTASAEYTCAKDPSGRCSNEHSNLRAVRYLPHERWKQEIPMKEQETLERWWHRTAGTMQ